MSSFFFRPATKVLTLVLLLQAAAFYGFSRGEHVPKEKPLADFSISSPDWSATRDLQLDAETLDVLKADDTLSRMFVNRQTGTPANLFIAYFSTQRTGKTPHSPKNCLPGSGWTPSEASTAEVRVPGEAEPIRVNRYVVSRDQAQSVVLYWYQSHNRVVASEYQAKIYTVLDSIRYNRSDTALVRIVVNAPDGDVGKAAASGISLIKAVFQPLKQYLPV